MKEEENRIEGHNEASDRSRYILEPCRPACHREDARAEPDYELYSIDQYEKPAHKGREISKEIHELSKHVKGILSFEINAGQMIEDIRLAVEGNAPVAYYGRMGGIVPTPEEVVEALKKELIMK